MLFAGEAYNIVTGFVTVFPPLVVVIVVVMTLLKHWEFTDDVFTWLGKTDFTTPGTILPTLAVIPEDPGPRTAQVRVDVASRFVAVPFEAPAVVCAVVLIV